MSSVQRPDVPRILCSLKDFQRETVDWVYRRMYQDADCTRRFLLADEVGLGKTLVARGLTALAIDRLWDTTERIDVIYICSNADIARQNISRLNVSGQQDYQLASRVTMLPVELHNLRGNKLNFVSLTPSTSFDLRSSLGTVNERALLYGLLRDHWQLGNRAGPLNVLQGFASAERFREHAHNFSNHRDIDEALAEGFRARLDELARVCQADAKPDLRARFEALCERYVRWDSLVSEADADERRAVVGELRAVLASSCLKALEPDLIILDEFQRFKNLLDGDSDACLLARELFDYGEHSPTARVLLLSATPYKMYTQYDEAGGEEHYADFLRTLRFLLDDEVRLAECEGLLGEYRRALQGLDVDRSGEAQAVMRRLEAQLRRVMVRTERLAASEDRDGMLTTVPATVQLDQAEPMSYLALQRVAEALDEPDAIEYWKSAPYLLNFMEDYKLKERFSEALESADACAAMARVLGPGSELLLPLGRVDGYEAVPDSNARLRWLSQATTGKGLWQLLWIPPAMPYYPLRGAFSDAQTRGATKHLVFSSWHVVPRAVAALLSYQAEREMFRSFESSPVNTAEARKKRRGLLRFAETEGRVSGLPLFLLLYPSPTLASLGDPLGATAPPPGAAGASLEELLGDIKARLAHDVRLLALERTEEIDEAWYWIAPVLLDLGRAGHTLREWLSQKKLAQVWTGDEGDEAEEEEGQSEQEAEQRAFGQAVDQLQQYVDGKRPLGRQPADLVEVLALAAVAAPGVCAYRALSRLVGDDARTVSARMKEAAGVAWAFRSVFNQPETMALLRGRGGDRPYWRQVLEYCADGCLTAVLDEYAHILREAVGLVDGNPEEVAERVGEVMRRALTLRTSTLAVDPLTSDGTTVSVAGARRMRLRFAMRFGDDKSEDGSRRSRADQVRVAFNSPFWPFVLVTTSVGQEGLDFHQYCHAVVHWNLPSNPVDLEQREGRVHRYKGHAVRKNLSGQYGLPAVAGSRADPWHTLFARAVTERPSAASDLVPFWVYPVADGARIERHVPHLPLSREVGRLEALRRSLAIYRMVFGQPRQEDLLAFLLNHLKPEDAAAYAKLFRIDLSPPRGPDVEAIPDGQAEMA